MTPKWTAYQPKVVLHDVEWLVWQGKHPERNTMQNFHRHWINSTVRVCCPFAFTRSLPAWRVLSRLSASLCHGTTSRRGESFTTYGVCNLDHLQSSQRSNGGWWKPWGPQSWDPPKVVMFPSPLRIFKGRLHKQRVKDEIAWASTYQFMYRIW